MKIPRNGNTITKKVQPAFAQPLMSWRRNRSPKTVNRSQKNRTHMKKTNIVHITWPNVYASNTASSQVLVGETDRNDHTTRASAAQRGNRQTPVSAPGRASAASCASI